jgi:hypothetical protein
MYFSGQEKHQETRIVKIQQLLKASRDSLHNTVDDANYFALENNDNAIDYFVEKGFTDTPALATKIKEGILEQNTNPKGNPLTGYEELDGQKFLINKVKILNNRWIIADFSNGNAWGDVLIRYFVDEKGIVTYETIQSLLYANTVK